MIKTKLTSVVCLAGPYLCIMALVALTSFRLGGQILSGYQAAIVEEKQKNIELGFERFLKRANDLQLVSYNIAQNSMLMEYFYDSIRGRGHSVMERKEIQKMLRDTLAVTEIQYTYLYDVGEDYVISNDLAVSSSELFYQYKYRMEGYTPGESAARARRMSKGYQPVIKADVSGFLGGPVMEYKSGVPLNNYSIYGEQMILIVAADDIFRDLEAALGTEGAFYVYDRDGTLMYESDHRWQEITEIGLSSSLQCIERSDLSGQEGLYGMECISPDGFWHVRICLDSSGWERVDRKSILYLAGAILFPFMAGILLCVYFTTRDYRKIKGLIEAMGSREPDVLKADWKRGWNGRQEGSETGGKTDTREEETEAEGKAETKGMVKAKGRAEVKAGQEILSYRLVQRYVDRMISENRLYKKAAADMGNVRKYEALDRLLRHSYGNREEMEALLDSVELTIRRENCAVLCIRFDNAFGAETTGYAKARNFIRETSEEITERNMEIFDVSSRETVCLLSLDETDVFCQVMEELVSMIKVKIQYRYDLEADFGAGNLAGSIYEIDGAYIQAEEVLRHNRIYENKILLYSELDPCEDLFFYPPETDDKIYSYVTTGHPSEAKEILREIFWRNFEDRTDRTSEKSGAAVRRKLGDAVLAIAGKYGIALREEELRLENGGYEQYWAALCEAVDFLSGKIENKKKNVQNQSAVKIREYVKANFCDSGISIGQISHALGFHENYISNLFKNVYGENLSVFIEKLRMEKACEMLRGGDGNIREIADKVGYTTEASFRRAFKKVYGMTPGEYRGY